ncbi:MAG: carboxymuconolactone decarboxylase family protein [Microbacterium sp.]|uniref:carboxymuconolactone decarboxylase family protein n=1 Tax=Microbacterium sp. TaxID=51671 RepID=UPI0039E3BFDF
MRERLPRFQPVQLAPAQRELYEQITAGPRAQGPQHFALTDENGALRGPFNAFLLAPPLGQALQELGAGIRYRTGLTARAREAAILLVAARWDSAFEREAHEAVGRAAGLTESELAALTGGDVPDFANREEAACARLTIALLDGEVDDVLWREEVEVIGRERVFELTVLVGYYSMVALQLRVFRV